MNEKKISTSTIAMIALMTAVTCILGPLSVPIGPVPISLTNLAIYFTVILLGWKKGTVSYVIYLLIGLVGVPVFSSFSAGPAKLFGPTGGYLIGFIFLAMISGWFIEKFPGKRVMYFVGMVLGTAVCYALGTAWLAYEAEMTFQAALMAGVIPFIIGDIAKMIVAIIVVDLQYLKLINCAKTGGCQCIGIFRCMIECVCDKMCLCVITSCCFVKKCIK